VADRERRNKRRQNVDRLIDEVGVPAASRQCRVAGILFTYRCSIRCRHCLFGCAGDRPDAAMAPRQCADALAMLHETGRVVHIAGGEAMLYWDALAESVRLAHSEGNAPHFIETNCSFASHDDIVRERFAFFADHGMKGILASADPFHQEFVPPERFLRVRRIAIEIFGEKNFYGPRSDDEKIMDLPNIAKDAGRLRDYVRNHAPVIVGSSREFLAKYLDAFPPDDPQVPVRSWGPTSAAENCSDQFRDETMWELHVDPYGNIQTNCGMILGRVNEIRPAQLLETGPDKANRFVRVVCEKGARGLAELAQREYGFAAPERVTQLCELCYLARRHLRPFHPEVFGPEEVYA